MPLFTYACRDCGASFEMLNKGEAGIACPECGSQQTDRGLSRFAPLSASAAGADAAACDLGAMCCGGGCGMPMN